MCERVAFTPRWALLIQSSFGCKPYSALLGAIKHKDEVMLHIDLATMPE